MNTKQLPTKSYIWGYITGITAILLGVTPILALLFYSVDGEWSFSFIKSLVTSIQWTELVGHIYPTSSPEGTIWILLCVSILVGVLIVFKKSLGWYAHIWFLFLMGGLFLFVAGILVVFQINNRVDSDLLFGTATSLALSAFCFALFWIQDRYWRNRKANSQSNFQWESKESRER